LKVGKQHLAVADHGTVQEVNEEKVRLGAFGKMVARRKLGISGGDKKDTTFPQAKRRRTKSSQTLVMIQNILEIATPISLADIQILKSADGSWRNPYLWPSVALAPDRGPDMTCSYHFGVYQKSLNLSVFWDLCHILKTSSSKILRKVGLYNHALLWSLATNACYGSTLSPPRMVQTREAVHDVMDAIPPKEDEHFMCVLEDLIDQMKLGISMTDDNVEDIVHKKVRDHKVLYTKPMRVNLGKFQAITYSPLQTLQDFTLKGYLYTKACIGLGYTKQFAVKAKPKSSAAASSHDGPKPVAVETTGKLTLKQEGVAAEKLTIREDTNTLEKAAMFFSDINNYHKSNICCEPMAPLAHLHSYQAKGLRSLENVVPFELEYMDEKMWELPRETMASLVATNKYKKYGLICEWGEGEEVCLNDTIVTVNNERAGLLWDVVMASNLEAEWRNLEWLCSHPRRQTLLLHKNKAKVVAYIEEVATDYELYNVMKGCDDDFAVAHCKRSLMSTIPVIQLVLCLEKDGWTLSPRHAVSE